MSNFYKIPLLTFLLVQTGKITVDVALEAANVAAAASGAAAAAFAAAPAVAALAAASQSQ